MEDKDNIHTAAGKREFLTNFLDSVRDELIGRAADMPDEWDGHELRWLVADKFEFEQHHRERNRVAKDWRQRFRDYTCARMGINL